MSLPEGSPLSLQCLSRGPCWMKASKSVNGGPIIDEYTSWRHHTAPIIHHPCLHTLNRVSVRGNVKHGARLVSSCTRLLCLGASAMFMLACDVQADADLTMCTRSRRLDYLSQHLQWEVASALLCPIVGHDRCLTNLTGFIQTPNWVIVYICCNMPALRVYHPDRSPCFDAVSAGARTSFTYGPVHASETVCPTYLLSLLRCFRTIPLKGPKRHPCNWDSRSFHRGF